MNSRKFIKPALHKLFQFRHIQYDVEEIANTSKDGDEALGRVSSFILDRVEQIGDHIANLAQLARRRKNG